MKLIEEQDKLKACSAERNRPDAADLAAVLRQYGVEAASRIEMIDSSHGADDIRWNYVVDRNYVLRFCNAPDMTDARMEDLNRLIARYQAFGLRCPAFLKAKDGGFFQSWRDLSVYLAEYVDLPLADGAEGEAAVLLTNRPTQNCRP